jgi:hypothetical protein
MFGSQVASPGALSAGVVPVVLRRAVSEPSRSDVRAYVQGTDDVSHAAISN